MATTRSVEGGRGQFVDGLRKTRAAERLGVVLQTMIDIVDVARRLPPGQKAGLVVATPLLAWAINTAVSSQTPAEQQRNNFVSGLQKPGHPESFADGVYDVKKVRSAPFSKVYDPSDTQSFNHSVQMPLIYTNNLTNQEYFAFGEDYNRNGQIDNDEVKFVPRDEAKLEEGTGTGDTITLPVSKTKPIFGTTALDGTDGNIFEVGIIEDDHIDPNE